MQQPIVQFQTWWKEALLHSPLQQKSAVCLSSIDADGFPAGRFVDLKWVDETGFVFCSYFDSAKGRQIQQNPKVALTIWWDHLGYQVRIVGKAEQISAARADSFWNTRSKSAQLTTTAFRQSEPMASEAELGLKLQAVAANYADQSIPRPSNWGGYCIKPLSIEFLRFRQSRLHLRELYKYHADGWTKQLLQP
jgi:pyridoxamine 5'-phosphate oxidase